MHKSYARNRIALRDVEMHVHADVLLLVESCVYANKASPCRKCESLYKLLMSLFIKHPKYVAIF